MSKIFKIGSAAGGVGTIAGATATTVLISQRPDLEKTTKEETKIKLLSEARKDLEDFIKTFKIEERGNEENLFKAIKKKADSLKKAGKIDLSKIFHLTEEAEKEIISPEKIKEISEELDDDSTRGIVEDLKESKLKEIEGFEEKDGKNNLCDLVQREGVRRIIKGDFKYVSEKDGYFSYVFYVCMIQ